MASSPVLYSPPHKKRTPELVQDILKHISEGESVASLWVGDSEKYPHPTTWSVWVRDDPQLSLASARARQQGADFHAVAAHQAFHTKPEMIISDKGNRMDGAHVTWLKNQGDFHMKRAAQLDQNQYGEKTLLAGHDGGEIKSNVALSMPQIMEEMRQAKKRAKQLEEGGAVIEATPESVHSDRALLKQQEASVPVHHNAPLLAPRTVEHGARAAEPGDPGMEFV